jgi:hypothetical protein
VSVNTKVPQSTHTCFRIKGSLGGGGIYNNSGCTAWINGVELTDSSKFGSQAAIADGYVYIEISGCSLSYTGFGTW